MASRSCLTRVPRAHAEFLGALAGLLPSFERLYLLSTPSVRASWASVSRGQGAREKAALFQVEAELLASD